MWKNGGDHIVRMVVYWMVGWGEWGVGVGLDLYDYSQNYSVRVSHPLMKW